MSDAIDTTFMDGHGPSYSVRALSKVTGRPYWETAYNQLRAHVTQYKPQLELLAATNDAGREQMLTNAPPGTARTAIAVQPVPSHNWIVGRLAPSAARRVAATRVVASGSSR